MIFKLQEDYSVTRVAKEIAIDKMSIPQTMKTFQTTDTGIRELVGIVQGDKHQWMTDISSCMRKEIAANQAKLFSSYVWQQKN